MRVRRAKNRVVSGKESDRLSVSNQSMWLSVCPKRRAPIRAVIFSMEAEPVSETDPAVREWVGLFIFQIFINLIQSQLKYIAEYLKIKVTILQSSGL